MFTLIFWKDATERALKTFAQGVTGQVIILCPVMGMDILNLNWIPILAFGGVLFLLSILTSMASSFKGEPNSASLIE